MGTKNQPGKFDCYKNALPDEPMFTLLARDPSAPALVEQWGRQREAEIREGKRPASDEGAVAEAYGCATAMTEWRGKNDGVWRRPDMVNYGERLGKIIRDHCDLYMNEEQQKALCIELQNEWLTPIKHMSCTALKPCGLPDCSICKPKGK